METKPPVIEEEYGPMNNEEKQPLVSATVLQQPRFFVGEFAQNDIRGIEKVQGKEIRLNKKILAEAIDAPGVGKVWGKERIKAKELDRMVQEFFNNHTPKAFTEKATSFVPQMLVISKTIPSTHSPSPSRRVKASPKDDHQKRSPSPIGIETIEVLSREEEGQIVSPLSKLPIRISTRLGEVVQDEKEARCVAFEQGCSPTPSVQVRKDLESEVVGPAPSPAAGAKSFVDSDQWHGEALEGSHILGLPSHDPYDLKGVWLMFGVCYANLNKKAYKGTKEKSVELVKEVVEQIYQGVAKQLIPQPEGPSSHADIVDDREPWWDATICKRVGIIDELQVVLCPPTDELQSYEGEAMLPFDSLAGYLWIDVQYSLQLFESKFGSPRRGTNYNYEPVLLSP
eukprot:Gb_39237 [translate_table: standard]